MTTSPAPNAFTPYAEQIAQASAEEVGFSPAILVPLIEIVLPMVLICLKQNNLDPSFAITQESEHTINDDHRRSRLASRYWRKSRRAGGPKLNWDQSLALARHTLTTGLNTRVVDLLSLTDLAMSMPQGDE